jgi:hypothetical protein
MPNASLRFAAALVAIGLLAGCSGGGALASSSAGRLVSESDLDLDWSRQGEVVGILGHGCDVPDRIWQRAGGQFDGARFASDDLVRQFAQGVIRVDDAATVYEQIIAAAPDCEHVPTDGPALGQQATWWTKDATGDGASMSVLVRSSDDTLHYFVSTSYSLSLDMQAALIVASARYAGIGA